MSDDLIERARAMIAAAVAQGRTNGGPVAALHLTHFPHPDVSLDAIRAAIDAVRRGTPVESAQLVFSTAPSRYICWNCCGLRFEGRDGICPNCESEALLVPEEILFALDRVVASGEA
jgi:Zn finger protein HypA/HybF involved in hydrogenase expression